MNLQIETESVAKRLLFNARHCTGVSYLRAGEEKEVRAAREVIVCAGSVRPATTVYTGKLRSDESAGTGAYTGHWLRYLSGSTTQSRHCTGRIE